MISLERYTAHSTRAFKVQSRAPLSTTVTFASLTSDGLRFQDGGLDLFSKLVNHTALDGKLYGTIPGSTVTWASLDSRVPAMAAFLTSIFSSSYKKTGDAINAQPLLFASSSVYHWWTYDSNT